MGEKGEVGEVGGGGEAGEEGWENNLVKPDGSSLQAG